MCKASANARLRCCSDADFLEEALEQLGSNVSPEERINAALAASQSAKTELACMRQVGVTRAHAQACVCVCVGEWVGG